MSERDDILEELRAVQYVGAAVSKRLYEELGVESIEELVEVGRSQGLTDLDGIGEAREGDILESAEELLEAKRAAEEELARQADIDLEEAEEPAEPEDSSVGVKEVDRTTPLDEGEESPAEPAVAEEASDEVEEAIDHAQEAVREADEEPGEEVEDEAAEEATAGEEIPRPRIDRFIERLRCPACGHDEFDRGRNTLTCTACRRDYRIRDGIADLAPPSPSGGGLAQMVMESKLYAQVYEDWARPNLTKLVSDRTMREERALATEYLDLGGDSTVLDVACGTGNFTRHFAKEIAGAVPGYDDRSLVVGMDLSWPMLEHARTYLRREGITDRVFLLRGNATRIPIGRETFSRLHCAGGLHLMSDIDQALRNFARVLEPGGICVIGTFLADGNLLKRIAKRLSEVPTSFHWFERDELFQRLERAGFEVVTDSTSREAITVKARRT
ncbi:MAG: methyltransferase domain-containing protein [Bradymonadaceae bacterium]